MRHWVEFHGQRYFTSRPISSGALCFLKALEQDPELWTATPNAMLAAACREAKIKSLEQFALANRLMNVETFFRDVRALRDTLSSAVRDVQPQLELSPESAGVTAAPSSVLSGRSDASR